MIKRATASSPDSKLASKGSSMPCPKDEAMRYPVLGLLLLGAPPAMARDPLATGSAVNTHAGIGAVVGDDAASVLTTPAGLSGATTGFQAYSEASAAALRTSYSHPGYDPYAINAVAPLVAAGGAYTAGSVTAGFLA